MILRQRAGLVFFLIGILGRLEMALNGEYNLWILIYWIVAAIGLAMFVKSDKGGMRIMAKKKGTFEDPENRTVRGWFKDRAENIYHFQAGVKLVNRRWYDRRFFGFKVEYLIETSDGEEIWVYSISPVLTN